MLIAKCQRLHPEVVACDLRINLISTHSGDNPKTMAHTNPMAVCTNAPKRNAKGKFRERE